MPSGETTSACALFPARSFDFLRRATFRQAAVRDGSDAFRQSQLCESGNDEREDKFPHILWVLPAKSLQPLLERVQSTAPTGWLQCTAKVNDLTQDNDQSGVAG